MRTTVTLDDDTELLLRARAQERGVSFEQALNDAIRDGVRGEVAPRSLTPTHAMGRPRVDLTDALALAGDLEDEGRLARLRADASTSEGSSRSLRNDPVDKPVNDH